MILVQGAGSDESIDGSIEAHLLEETLLEENMKLEVEKCTGAHCYNNRTRRQQILEKFYLVIPKT